MNLETLISTAALIHEFPRDLSLETELAKVTLEQIPLVTQRYRARVGDSRTPETFELNLSRKHKKYPGTLLESGALLVNAQSSLWSA